MRIPCLAALLSPLLMAVLLASPARVLASCALPPGVEVPRLEELVRDGEVVFVGTVASTSNRDTWATVRVEEVWRGPDLPVRVVVKGGFGDMTTSADRTFTAGTRYLFVPTNGEEGLSDNACSATRPWEEALVAVRPADARQPLGATSQPSESGIDIAGILAPVGVALVAGLVLLGAGLMARGRQSS